MKIDSVAILHMILKACTYAAGEIIIRPLVDFVSTLLQRKIVNNSTLRAMAGKNVIIQCSFKEISHFCLGPPAKHMTRELQHVIHVASLGGILAQSIVQFVRLREMLAITVSARNV